LVCFVQFNLGVYGYIYRIKKVVVSLCVFVRYFIRASLLSGILKMPCAMAMHLLGKQMSS
jgi:hypothetical protein